MDSAHGGSAQNTDALETQPRNLPADESNMPMASEGKVSVEADDVSYTRSSTPTGTYVYVRELISLGHKG